MKVQKESEMIENKIHRYKGVLNWKISVAMNQRKKNNNKSSIDNNHLSSLVVFIEKYFSRSHDYNDVDNIYTISTYIHKPIFFVYLH